MSDATSAPVFLTWERRVAAELGVVRTQLRRALQEQRFDLMGDTVTSIEAQRGSQMAAFVLQHDNLPMTAHVRLQPLEGACGVSVQLQETGRVPSRYLGTRNAYAKAFAELQQRIDEELAELDPSLKPVPATLVPQAPMGLGDQLGTAAGDFGRRVVQGANRLLEGKDTSTPTAWKELDQVVFVSSQGEAVVAADRAQAMSVVAGLVASQPGSMPPNLAHDVELFAARLESEVDTSAGADYVRLAVSDSELPVMAFLVTQALIRESLPLRTLHVCTTCRLERVTNPDYERMAERHRKLKALSYGVGATFSRRGLTPFVLVGQLVRVKKLDPDFVCSRCQSTTADEWVVTFCPKCGDRRQEAVLRACPKCKYDFRKGVHLPELWHPAPALPAGPPIPAPAGAYAAPVASYGPPVAPYGAAVSPYATSAPPVPVPAAGPTVAPGAAAVPQPPPQPPPLPPQGWYNDPYGRYPQRWWDGSRWSQHVNGGTGPATDPV